MYKKSITLVVILTFLYSNFIWANPQSPMFSNPVAKETLSYDNGAFLARLAQYRGNLQDASNVLERRPEVFAEVLNFLSAREAKGALLGTIVKTLFAIFGDVLRDVREKDVSGLSAADGGIGIESGNKAYILRQEVGDDGHIFSLAAAA